MNPSQEWAVVFREYLARRKPSLLDKARSATSDRDLAALFDAHLHHDYDRIEEIAPAVHLAFLRSGLMSEALTVELLRVDLYARLVEGSDRYPLEKRAEALRMGIEGCDQAILFATVLADLPCLALYQSVKGVGLRKMGELSSAVESLERGVQTYRVVAEELPDIYLPVLANSLGNLGNAYGMLRRSEDALAVCKECLRIFRQLATAQPAEYLPLVAQVLGNVGNVYQELGNAEAAISALQEGVTLYRQFAMNQRARFLPHLAFALNNLGNARFGLRQLEKARDAHQEVLSIRRPLAEHEPHRYGDDLASTLSNLGNVLRELRELDLARTVYEEAVAIYRRLAETQPGAYLPALATALNNLSNVLSDAFEFAGARETLDAALAIRRRLAIEHPEAYQYNVASTLSNLAGVWLDLNDLGAARTAFEESLAIYRELARLTPTAYDDRLAAVLINLGGLLQRTNESAAARSRLEEALSIYHRLAEAEPETHLSNTAMALNNLAVVMEDLQDLAGAERAARQSLFIRRQLAQKLPGAHLPDVAVSLGNLGSVLLRAGQPAAAREGIEEAIQIFEQLGLWIDSSKAYFNLGLLEERAGKTDRAVSLFQTCVTRCERGLHQLRERQHRDVFKAQIEPAYQRLIAYYARAPLATDGSEPLVWLLESLRQVECLANVSGTPLEATDHSRVGLSALREASGPLAEWSGRDSCLFVWIQATAEGIVFVTASPSTFSVDMAGPQLLQSLRGLFLDVQFAMVNEHAGSEDIETRISRAGAVAFSQLPARIQQMLAGEGKQLLILSPCAVTVNLPFELLKVPDHFSPDAPNRPAYVGLRHVLPRVRGLTELSQVIHRTPRGKAALVVGNPLHSGSEPLRDARRAALHLTGELEHLGYDCTTLLDSSASCDAAREALARPGTCLWAQMGHGWRTDDQERTVEVVAMAGSDRFLPGDIGRLHLKGNPLVHFDCCVAGTTHGRGGGRFDGHPSGALMAGASCVLSSVHPLWDDAAAEFSSRFYNYVLQQNGPLPFGEALIRVRHEMAGAYPRNPLVWGTTVLWGNADARLR